MKRKGRERVEEGMDELPQILSWLQACVGSRFQIILDEGVSGSPRQSIVEKNA